MYEFTNQPIGWDATGEVIRFKENRIVSTLLEVSSRREIGYGLNQIAMDKSYSKDNAEDSFRQLRQLTGYSVSGYGDCYPEDPSLGVLDDEASDIFARQSLRDMVANKDHPMQPMYYNGLGLLSFVPNPIVVKLAIMTEQHINPLRMIRDNEFSLTDGVHYLQLLGLTAPHFKAAVKAASVFSIQHYPFIQDIFLKIETKPSISPKTL